MNVIGLSGLSHSLQFKKRKLPGLSQREYYVGQGFDAAAVLVGDDGIIAAAAEERFTREKATGAFPVNAIRYCLKAANLKPTEIDWIAHGFAYEPHKSIFENEPYTRDQYQEVFSPEAQRKLLEEHFAGTGWSEKFIPVPHHLAHAASAFFPSGFDEALILVSDGMGEVQSATVATGQGNDIKVLTEISAFHSLGILYGVFSLYLGFYMNSDEYKIMGLAPYGNARRFFSQMMSLVSLKNDGTYTIPAFAHNRTFEERETHRGIINYLVEQFGPAREPESDITQTHKDLAAGLQALLQTCQLHVLRHFKRQTGLKNLCLAGGVALNCSANGVVKRSELFDEVFVQPASGDDGTALGAALWVQREKNRSFKRPANTVPLWGSEFSDEEISGVLDSRKDCRIVKPESYDALCREVAGHLSRGEIVAWFQGRMEFGPRALGSRSILADPRDPTMRDRINALVKKREAFRPFAPVVTAEAAAEIFEIKPGDEGTYAHMLFVTHVRPEYRSRLPATTHVDGSARAQTVSHDQNPRLWQLLSEFATLTDIPVLLNTSFNVRGQPIVCTPEEAIDTFLTARLDVLVLGDYLVYSAKSEASPAPEPEAEANLAELQELADRHEEFWVNRLATLEPLVLPFKRKELPSNGEVKRQGIYRQEISDVVRNSIKTEDEIVAAFAAFLSRLSATETFHVGFSEDSVRAQLRGAKARFASLLPLEFSIESTDTLKAVGASAGRELQKVRTHGTFTLDLASRHPTLNANPEQKHDLPVAIHLGSWSDEKLPSGTELMLVASEGGKEWTWIYDEALFDEQTIQRLAGHFKTFIEALPPDREQAIATLPLLSEAERKRILFEWNDTHQNPAPRFCIHEAFEAQVSRSPDAVALVFEEQQLTYRELDERASRMAARLRQLGIGPDNLVGLCVERSVEMMVALLGVLKAGGAYVPLDPTYPRERIGYMVEDAGVSVLVTERSMAGLLDEALHFSTNGNGNGAKPSWKGKLVYVDEPAEPGENSLTLATSAATNGHAVGPDNLVYVIYTSGSTGKPKGVMINHANVANFFMAMDERLGTEPGTWLAVTSMSFDISVLELFWTLARGFKVVLQPREGRARSSKSVTRRTTAKELDFSLFYFASDESSGAGDKYRLLIEGAKFADEHGFAAVWTPERHFHSFGGLYPNPSITSAALATITNRLQIRAGSVVLPLHHPLRVAEEWAVVDNLSHGRVAISFASGWQINDFVLAPENHASRKEIMVAQIGTVQKLWRGETVLFRDPKGKEVPIKILPRPVQQELPIWITASGNPETYKLAGELGANVLTHLLGQNVAELAEKIGLYRRAWQQAGHAGEGRVTVMLHTFVGRDLETVRETVRKPFTAYLRTSIDLIKNDPWAFSTFKRPADQSSNGNGNGAHQFTEEEMDAIAEHAFERHFSSSGLFGTPQHCLAMVEQMRSAGADEIACLIDFGVDAETVLASLDDLDELRKLANESPTASHTDYSVAAQIRRHEVTHLQCTPSMAAMLAEDERNLEAIRSLKKLLLGGEALPGALIERLQFPGEILNMYGPTETTIWSSTHSVEPVARTASASLPAIIPIGRPIANTDMYIVDHNVQPQPVGVPGELLIGGAGVVRGYLHRPELTAEQFIANPFKPGAGERVYRTSDLARYLPDGTIEFLGRSDHQVKLRGFRIELGEIEAALRSHPSVKDCVAIVREDAPGDKRLVAYIVPNGGHTVSTPELRQHAQSRLPDYMVPSACVSLTALRLTPNGKIDRKALPRPVFPAEQAMDDRAASPAEQAIRAAMCEVLGLAQIDLQANFFELGGNSLLATQLIGRLRRSFARDLPLRLAFEFPTPRALAGAIENKADTVTTAETPEDVSAKPAATEKPLSFAQQRIWFLHQLEPGSHYNDRFDLRLEGPVDHSILERTINEIVRRHETLRATFHMQDGNPVQKIAPALKLAVPVIDLSKLGAEERERQARQVAIDECNKFFDLETGPLLRALLIKLAEKQHILALTFDHIIIDGWSHGVFLSELIALYGAFAQRQPSPLPPLPLQYADYAAWQGELLESAEGQRHLAYWRKQLSDAPPLLELPTDRPRPRVPSYRGAREPLLIDKQLINQLTALGRRERCTLFMVLLGAFQTLLGRYAESEDILIGSPIANRSRTDVEGLIGSFMNTLVLRGDLRGDLPFRELLRRVRAMALDAYTHQDLPFEKLVAELQPTRDLSYSPLFQIMFILQNTPMPVFECGDLKFSSYEVDAGSSKLDLTLNLEETWDGCVGWIEYSSDLFDRSTIKRLIENFQKLLTRISMNPAERLSELSSFVTLQGAEAVTRVEARTTMMIDTPIIPTPELTPSARSNIPTTAVEKELAKIWSNVLGVATIQLHDNLFDLGGHSLLVTRIISRIRKAFDVEVPIHAFFETPTVFAIARQIEQNMEARKNVSA